MKFIPTLAPTSSDAFWASAFSILFATTLVGVWLGGVYWKTSVDLQNAKNFAEIRMVKARAFTARLEAAERALSPSPTESRSLESRLFIGPDSSSYSKPKT